MEYERASQVGLTYPLGNLCERYLIVITRIWAIGPIRAHFFLWILDNFPAQTWANSLVPSGP